MVTLGKHGLLFFRKLFIGVGDLKMDFAVPHSTRLQGFYQKVKILSIPLFINNLGVLCLRHSRFDRSPMAVAVGGSLGQKELGVETLVCGHECVVKPTLRRG